MLISDEKRVLFVHVPKTGGVSIEDVVKDACPDARRKPRDAAGVGRHATLEVILDKEPELSQYWSFGFVRNPWARMWSWYSMISRWDRRNRPDSGRSEADRRRGLRAGNDMWRAAAAYSGFEEFVLRGTEELERVGVPQIDYLRSASLGREVDLIGRTERLPTDVNLVQAHLGVLQTPPPHRNKSFTGDYRAHYSDQARRKVAEVFAEDIERFEYTF